MRIFTALLVLLVFAAIPGLIAYMAVKLTEREKGATAGNVEIRNNSTPSTTMDEIVTIKGSSKIFLFEFLFGFFGVYIWMLLFQINAETIRLQQVDLITIPTFLFFLFGLLLTVMNSYLLKKNEKGEVGFSKNSKYAPFLYLTAFGVVFAAFGWICSWSLFQIVTTTAT